MLLLCSSLVIAGCASAPPASTIVTKVTPQDVLAAETPQEVFNKEVECLKYSGTDAQMQGIRPMVNLTNVGTAAQIGASVLGVGGQLGGQVGSLINMAGAAVYKGMEHQATETITTGIRAGAHACHNARKQRLSELGVATR